MIKLLLKSVSDKIAAGEVVESPSSVVKELVENSIDSGAKSIIVEIKKGGSAYIRVTDDGIGIPDDEVELAFTRHATSKINTEKDLDNLITLGFRGEALPSIAAVSKTEIITKTNESRMGTKLVLEGGKFIEKNPVGAPDGTTIIVENLFYNTPARKKFMKSNASESNKIIDLIKHIALAYPNIKVRMISGDSILFATRGTGKRIDVIMTLNGIKMTEKLIKIEASDDDFSLEGYVSGPGESRPNKKEQIFFVNGRVVYSKVIEHAISIAYKERLFEGRHPITYLFLKVNPNTLDVNIHPNKKQIRFDDDEKVISFLSTAIKNGIITKQAIPEIDVKTSSKDNLIDRGDNLNTNHFKGNKVVSDGQSIRASKINVSDISQKLDLSTDNELFKDNNLSYSTSDSNDESGRLSEIKNGNIVYENKPKKGDFLKESYFNKDISDDRFTNKNNIFVEDKTQQKVNIKDVLTAFQNENQIIKEKAEILSNEKNLTGKENVFDGLNILATIFDTYIICSDEDNIYLIDQHAAHERIYYEEIMKQSRERKVFKQSIMIPITFNCIRSDEEWINSLNEFGFTIEEFGPSTYIAREIPTFLDIHDAEIFLNDYVAELDEKTDFRSENIRNKMATMACKAAVKAHDHLKDEEIKTLISDLEKCENPYSCPHGRPTFIKLSKYEIEKRFKRIV